MTQHKYHQGSFWIFTLLLALVSSHCASPSPPVSSPRLEIRHQVKDYVFDRGVPTVWAKAKQMLEGAGYTFPQQPKGKSFVVESEWKSEQGIRTRYLVQAIYLDRAKCKLHITRNVVPQRRGRLAASEKSGSARPALARSIRDLDLEWRLIQEVDPGAAEQIRQRAEEISKLST